MGIELVVLAKTGAADVASGAAELVEELAPRVVRGIKATGLEVLLLADMLDMLVLEELVLGKRVGRMAGAEEEVIIGMAVVLLTIMLELMLELEELELTVDSGMTDMTEAELEVVLFIIMLELEELELELELGPTVVMGMIGMAWRELLLVLVLAEVLLLETMGTRVAVGAAEEEDDQLDQVEPVHEEELLLGETSGEL